MMTPRERFLKVLAGEMPDRVPVTLFIQDKGYFLNQNYPNIDPWDHETLQQVKRETELAMKNGKPGGKFILQPVDFLEFGTPMENVDAYVKTAMQFAAY